MCEKYAGKVVAITGFKNEDIQDHQYPMFLRYAKKFDCRVHCLGMTRKKVLDVVPFDYVDSSSWSAESRFGRIGRRKVTREFSKDYGKCFILSYLNAMNMQEHYFRKWGNTK